MTYWKRFVRRVPFALVISLGIFVAQPVVRVGSEHGGAWWLVPIGAFVVWIAVAAYIGAWLAARERTEERREAIRRRRAEALHTTSDRDAPASP